MRLAQLCDRLRRLQWEDRLLVLEAGVCLGVARLAVLALPLRWIVPPPRPATAPGRPARRAPDLAAAISPTLHGSAQRVGRAVVSMSRHTPWHSRCLEQAIAARWMLGRRGVPTTLHLGVTRGAPTGLDPEALDGLRNGEAKGALQAHAWLTSDAMVVVGGPHVSHYALLASFADDVRGTTRAQQT